MEQLKNRNKNVFLSFNLGKETFAVSVKKVLEVLQQQQYTEIPDVPDFIKGVINFRGDILPVIDARSKFNIKVDETSVKNVIIVLDLTTDNQKFRIGAIADQVKDVLAFDEKEIKPVPEMGLKYNAEYISGMIKNGESFIMILDVHKVFSGNEVNLLKESTVAYS